MREHKESLIILLIAKLHIFTLSEMGTQSFQDQIQSFLRNLVPNLVPRNFQSLTQSPLSYLVPNLVPSNSIQKNWFKPVPNQFKTSLKPVPNQFKTCTNRFYFLQSDFAFLKYPLKTGFFTNLRHFSKSSPQFFS